MYYYSARHSDIFNIYSHILLYIIIIYLTHRAKLFVIIWSYNLLLLKLRTVFEDQLTVLSVLMDYYTLGTPSQLLS